MTLFFGPRWDAPVVDHAEQIPTPAGARCYDCRERVVEGDRGFLRPHFTVVDGEPVGVAMAVHAECDLSAVLGHMVGVCSCTGWEYGRARAREVWRRVYAGRDG